MIFDFSDKINQHGLKVIFSNAEENNILTKKAIVSMSQIHSTNIELVNNKKLVSDKDPTGQLFPMGFIQKVYE